MSSSDSSGSDSFFSSFLASAGAPAAAAGPAEAGPAAPTPDPMFVIKSLTLQPSKALANKPGQYGSTSTLAALRIVWSFSPYFLKKKTKKCDPEISTHVDDTYNTRCVYE